jgi:uncharacterized protein YacL (UPF0231 family)
VHNEVKNNAVGIDRVEKTVEQLRQDLDKVKSAGKNDAKMFMTAEEYRERERPGDRT